MKKLLSLSVLVALGGAHTPPVASVEKIGLSIISSPEGAIIFRGDQEVGHAPVDMEILDWSEATRFYAKLGDKEPVETRLRMVSSKKGELQFRFGGPAKAFAQRLGVAKIFVFDIGGSVGFDVNKAKLKPEGEVLLANQAKLIKSFFGGVKFFVCGHTDATGSYQHNLELSLARAESVANFLKGNGIPAKQLTVMGFGSDFPLDSNDTPEGRAKNRRTELVLPRD
ncbi:MAG: OmpA family protein [Thermoanaerobaculaceae bacterium]